MRIFYDTRRMIRRYFTVYCDICHRELGSYAGHKPTLMQLHDDGVGIAFTDGKPRTLCRECSDRLIDTIKPTDKPTK